MNGNGSLLHCIILCCIVFLNYCTKTWNVESIHSLSCKEQTGLSQKPNSMVGLPGLSSSFPPRLILKDDNVISAPFISHAGAKRSNSLIESSQTPRPYLPCWANIVLKSHAPIVMHESCTAQLDRRRDYNGTLCPRRSPFELLKCLQRKRPKYRLFPLTHPRTSDE